MKPKDFQQATADRIVQVFRGGQNRVLLADEVGLGKTIVAREVVRQVAQWHKEELGDDHFKVIYICSKMCIRDRDHPPHAPSRLLAFLDEATGCRDESPDLSPSVC